MNIGKASRRREGYGKIFKEIILQDILCAPVISVVRDFERGRHT
jgi:hypothetical protein